MALTSIPTFLQAEGENDFADGDRSRFPFFDLLTGVASILAAMAAFLAASATSSGTKLLLGYSSCSAGW